MKPFNFYQDLSPGRGGARFETAFKQALQEVERGTITLSWFLKIFIEFFCGGFLTIVYYRLTRERGERAVTVGVLYARFDPKKIEAMLKQRS